jgi:subtilisin family serine protease
MSGDRGGTTLQIAQAARYAADNGASIIQGSFGFAGGTVTSDKQYETDYALEYQAFKYFIDTANGCDALKGGLVIMAAGNDALPYSAYPAAHREIVSVTATGIDGLPVPYSNYGPGSNISAPGGELTSYVVATGVLSTVPVEFGGDYGYKHGTSMACPHVSGVAALGLSYALKLGKTYTVNEFRSLLCTSTTDLNSRLEGSRTFEGTTLNLDSYRGKMGNGNVDAWKLLMAIDGTPCIQIPAEQEVLVDLAPVMGEQSEYMTYTSVSCSKDTEDSMGLMSKPEIVFGKLKLNCMFAGSGKFTIKAIAGGNNVGGGNVMGGTEVVREVSIISRYQSVSSNGGWL